MSTGMKSYIAFAID